MHSEPAKLFLVSSEDDSLTRGTNRRTHASSRVELLGFLLDRRNL